MIDRRGFLRRLLASPLALTLDVEQLLWIPGQQIVVPGLRTSITLDEINRSKMEQFIPSVANLFFSPSPLTKYLTTRFKEKWAGAVA